MKNIFVLLSGMQELQVLLQAMFVLVTTHPSVVISQLHVDLHHSSLHNNYRK